MPAGKTCTCGRRAVAGKQKCSSCQNLEDVKRTAKRESLHTPHFRRLRQIVLRRDRACWLCDGQDLLLGERWTVDHVVPRAILGSDELVNLKKAHSSCNERRGGRVVDDKLRAELQRRRRMDRG